jgi:predicted aldo/keto reductase-like oxidoreductase
MADDHNLSDSLKQASEKGIGLIAMKTQCSQYWYREHVPESGQRFYEGKIMHTAVLKWALRNPMITTAIPGFTTYQQLDEDFVVARNLDYTPDEKAFLEDRNVKLSLNYCLQCGHCVSTCPRRVDIPTLMRTHLYAACYSNFYQARDALDSIPKNQNLDSCSACDICMAKCLHHIDISRRINALKCIFA